MFYSNDMITLVAKRLALFANDRVTDLARSVASDLRYEYPPEITGATLAMLPHIAEKAIITNPALPPDISVKLSSMFVHEFEVVAKMMCNAGGFSNPIKKSLFNASFHLMFSRQYKELKPKFEGIWDMGRELREGPVATVALGLIKYCESSTGLKLESDSSVDRVINEVESFFSDVHAIIQK